MSAGIQHPPSYFTGLYNHFKEAGDLPPWLLNEQWGGIWFDALVFTALTIAVIIIFTLISVRRMNKVPGKLQSIFEVGVELLNGLLTAFIGPEGPKYLPFLGSIFIYILFMNLMGLIPGMKSPTMTLSTTFALGISTFLYVQAAGIRAQGLGGYLKHFAGEVLWLAPLMFVIHIMGELVKPCSLSLRLFGNIYGEDNVIAVLTSMSDGIMTSLGGVVPIPVQFPMAAFAVFTSFLQAFIFTALACIYIATLSEHHEEHGHEHAVHEH